MMFVFSKNIYLQKFFLISKTYFMKYLFSTLIVLLLSCSGHAQSLFQGVGGSYQYLLLNDSTGNRSETEGGPAYGITYKVRFNVFEIDDDRSISIATMPMVTFASDHYKRSTSQNISVRSLAVDVPIMIGYNIGASATEYSEGVFGGAINIGYGYSRGLTNEPITGPLIGFNIQTLDLCEINFIYMYATNEAISSSSFRFGLIYNISSLF